MRYTGQRFGAQQPTAFIEDLGSCNMHVWRAPKQRAIRHVFVN